MDEKWMIRDVQMAKRFAKKNWLVPCEVGQMTVADGEYAVADPWIDIGEHAELTDEQAVGLWGLEVLVPYIRKTIDRTVEIAHMEDTGGHIMVWFGKLANGKYYAMSHCDNFVYLYDEAYDPYRDDDAYEWESKHFVGRMTWRQAGKVMLSDAMTLKGTYDKDIILSDAMMLKATGEDPTYDGTWARDYGEACKLMKRIRKFAREQWSRYKEKPDDGVPFSIRGKDGRDMISPWVNADGADINKDADAVRLWGLEAVYGYCVMAADALHGKIAKAGSMVA